MRLDVNSHIEKAIFFAALVLLWLCLHPSKSAAYDLPTHGRLVSDAFRYMLLREAEAAPGQIFDYGNGWDSEKDYMVALDWLGLSSGANEEIVRARFKDFSNNLSYDASRPDKFRDIGFRSNRWWSNFLFTSDCIKEIADANITSISHFYLLPWDNDALWKVPGYTYDLSNRDDTDEVALSFLANLAGLSVATDCGNIMKYLDDRELKNKDEFANNWKRKIEEVRFPPATAMARFHYDKFVREPAVGNNPLDVHNLGPVFHAVDDVTVPYHVIGILGHGHKEYENLVGANYVDIYDPKRIREYLTKHDSQDWRWQELNAALDTSNDVFSIIHRLAHYTLNYEADPPRGKSRRNTDNFTYGPEIKDDVENTQRGEDLLNLAAAANVVVLRKALYDWRDHNNRAPQSKLAQPTHADPFDSTRIQDDYAGTETESGDDRPMQGLSIISRNSISELSLEDFLPVTWLERLPRTELRTELERIVQAYIGTAVKALREPGGPSSTQMQHLECALVQLFYTLFGKGTPNFGGGYQPFAIILRFSTSEVNYLYHAPRFRSVPLSGQSTQAYQAERDLYERVFRITQLSIRGKLFEGSGLNSLLVNLPVSTLPRPERACGSLSKVIAAYQEEMKRVAIAKTRGRQELEAMNVRYSQILADVSTLQRRGDQTPSNRDKSSGWVEAEYSWKKRPPGLSEEEKGKLYDDEQALQTIRATRASVQNELSRLNYYQGMLSEHVQEASDIQQDINMLQSYKRSILMIR